MALNTYDKRVIVFKWEYFQLSAPSHFFYKQYQLFALGVAFTSYGRNDMNLLSRFRFL